MIQKNTLKFAFVQWFYYSGVGLVFAFLTAYFQYLGYTNIQIGIAMGFVSVASMVGQPIGALVADKIGNPALVIMWALGLGCIAAFLLFYIYDYFFAVVLLSVFLSFFIQSLPPIIDSWIMDMKGVLEHVDYGIARSMGSIGFSLVVMIAGGMYDRWGLRLMFPGSMIAFLMTGVVIYFVHRKTKGSRGIDHSRVSPKMGITGGLRQFFSFNMNVILVLAFFAFTALRAAQIFLPVLLVEFGGNNTDLGFSLGLMAMSEVPFMVVSSWLLLRISDTKILFVSMIFFFLRIFVHGIAPNPQWIIFAQVLQGPSFGLFLPAFVHLLSRLAPVGTKALGQTAGNLATFGLGSVVGSTLGGGLIDSIGVVGMYWVMAAIMFVVLVLYGIAQRVLRF